MEPGFGRSLASGINMFLRTQSHQKKRTLVGQDIKILDLVTATAPCDPTRWSPASLPSLWRCLPWCRACGAANMLHSLPLKMKKPPRNRGLAITGSLQCAPHEGVFEGDGIPIYIIYIYNSDFALARFICPSLEAPSPIRSKWLGQVHQLDRYYPFSMRKTISLNSSSVESNAIQ